MADAWNTAIEFLLIDDRAAALASAHPLTADGRCAACHGTDCSAARLAAEALALRRARLRATG
jgi:hypothetical protein